MPNVSRSSAAIDDPHIDTLANQDWKLLANVSTIINNKITAYV